MYNMFCRNLNNYFEANIEGDPDTEFRLRIAQVLKGIADKNLYNDWAIKAKEKYEEVNNLVYEISQNIDRYHGFKIFSHDLWVYDFKAQKSNGFPKEIIEEQLKLVDLLLGHQYW